MKPHIFWSWLTIVIFVVVFGVIYWIHNAVRTHGGAPDPQASAILALLLSLLVTGFVGGFGFMLIFGAIYKETVKAEDGERTVCVTCGKSFDTDGESRCSECRERGRIA